MPVFVLDNFREKSWDVAGARLASFTGSHGIHKPRSYGDEDGNNPGCGRNPSQKTLMCFFMCAISISGHRAREDATDRSQGKDGGARGWPASTPPPAGAG